MAWSDVLDHIDRKIKSECRAGILIGFRLDLSDSAAAVLAVQKWAAQVSRSLSSPSASPLVELWLVDDLCGLAPRQPIFAGACILQAFGLDGDHRAGLSIEALDARIATATEQLQALRPSLVALLRESEKEPGELGAFFVWSGPLCGGFLVKGVLRDEYSDDALWHSSKAECRVYCASHGASQRSASGGVHGVSLFRATYDNSDEPPRLTSELLTAQDDRLARAGLLQQARIFVLPRYD